MKVKTVASFTRKLEQDVRRGKYDSVIQKFPSLNRVIYRAESPATRAGNLQRALKEILTAARADGHKDDLSLAEAANLGHAANLLDAAADEASRQGKPVRLRTNDLLAAVESARRKAIADANIPNDNYAMRREDDINARYTPVTREIYKYAGKGAELTYQAFFEMSPEIQNEVCKYAATLSPKKALPFVRTSRKEITALADKLVKTINDKLGSTVYLADAEKLPASMRPTFKTAVTMIAEYHQMQRDTDQYGPPDLQQFLDKGAQKFTVCQDIQGAAEKLATACESLTVGGLKNPRGDSEDLARIAPRLALQLFEALPPAKASR